MDPLAGVTDLDGIKLLFFFSMPLDVDTEVTGHPVITLYVSSTATDGEFFAYLEDVDANSTVTYVTEGELRAIHRKLSMDPPLISKWLRIILSSGRTPCRSCRDKSQSWCLAFNLYRMYSGAATPSAWRLPVLTRTTSKCFPAHHLPGRFSATQHRPRTSIYRSCPGSVC